MNAKVLSAPCGGSVAVVVAVLSLACSSSGVPAVGGAAGSGGASGTGGNPGAFGGSSSTAGAAGSSTGGGMGNGAGTMAGGAAGASGVSGASGSGGAGGAPVACQPPLPVTGTAVTVNVDLAMVKATVAPEVMSVHTSAYDNVMTAATTPPLLKAAGVRSLRYPGGSYGDGYHWSTHTMTPSTNYVAAGAHFGAFVGLMDAVGAGALITVNYGSNPQGTGPGVPQEAAAWVAYANGAPASTVSIGLDETGTDWKTVGYWASLRAASKLAVDDGLNFLRIGRAAPIGIKYWELGNELYGNGFYYGGTGWEIDMNVPQDGTERKNHPDLSPAKYGAVFPTFATAMKAVDPTIMVGAVLHWPYNEYTSPDWNDNVLSSGTCETMDFGVNHWYAGTKFEDPLEGLTDLLATPRRDIPQMFSDLAAKVKQRCPAKSGTIPLAITEWGPNTHNITFTADNTQLVGVFAADSYAHFMEQGAIHLDWLELHNDSYLTEADVPQWGYKGQQMAGYWANGGDAMVTATVETPPEAFAGGLLQAHAAKRVDGSATVMLVNTSPTAVAAATIKVAGLTAGSNLPCVGTRYTYASVDGQKDGQVTSAPIFSSNDATNQVSVEVPAYSVVVVAFPMG